MLPSPGESNAVPNRVGHCPWCHSEIRIESVSLVKEQYQWERCRTPRCQGNFFNIITDYHGYVIHPARMRDKYIY